jgi:hypothetical protein
MSITVNLLKAQRAPVRPIEHDFHKWMTDNESNLNLISSLFDEDGNYLHEMSASCFNDYYKFAMLVIFILLYKLFGVRVTFGVDIRTPEIKHQMATDEKLQEFIIQNLAKLATRKFNREIFAELREHKKQKGININLSDEDIDGIVFVNKKGQIVHRQLANENICRHKYVPDMEGYDQDDVVISCYMIKDASDQDQFQIETNGPAHLVTWTETTVMQNVYQSVMEFKRNQLKISYLTWLYNALLRCFMTIQSIKEENQAKPEDRADCLNGALFSGRRTGGLLFMLLQNYMVQDLYKSSDPSMKYLGSSSVESWYILKKLFPSRPELNPVGTHAHELSMVFSIVFGDLNKYGDIELPISQIFANYAFYSMCNLKINEDGSSEPQKCPMLPDTLGTLAFLAAGDAIRFQSQGADGTTTLISFFEKCISSGRQDSGCPIAFWEYLRAFGLKIAVMASEIDSIETLYKLLHYKDADGKFPFVLFGAGGLFGDSPKVWAILNSMSAWPSNQSVFFGILAKLDFLSNLETVKLHNLVKSRLIQLLMQPRVLKYLTRQ